MIVNIIYSEMNRHIIKYWNGYLYEHFKLDNPK